MDRTFNWRSEFRLLSALSPVLFKQVQGNPHLLLRALSSVLFNSVVSIFIWYDFSEAVGEWATKRTRWLALKTLELRDGGGRRWITQSRVGCTHIRSCRREEKHINRYSICQRRYFLRRGCICFFRSDGNRGRRAKYARYANCQYLLWNHNDNVFNGPINKCFP